MVLRVLVSDGIGHEAPSFATMDCQRCERPDRAIEEPCWSLNNWNLAAQVDPVNARLEYLERARS
jgi:hypothetical protein